MPRPQTYCDYFGFTLLLSFFAALNAVAGHELIHHRETHNKIIGGWTSAKLMYTNFVDEHVKGHHKHVSTPEDPATSRLNETFQAFFFRAMYGSIVNVWGYEASRILTVHGKDASLLKRIFYNKMFWYQVLHISILITVYQVFGWNAFKWNLLYIALGLYLFETVNYIEHYGILRKKDEDGIYEAVNKMHSWNYLSGAIIIRL